MSSFQNKEHILWCHSHHGFGAPSHVPEMFLRYDRVLFGQHEKNVLQGRQDLLLIYNQPCNSKLSNAWLLVEYAGFVIVVQLLWNSIASKIFGVSAFVMSLGLLRPAVSKLVARSEYVNPNLRDIPGQLFTYQSVPLN
jgi:hypothetical protein